MNQKLSYFLVIITLNVIDHRIAVHPVNHPVCSEFMYAQMLVPDYLLSNTGIRLVSIGPFPGTSLLVLFQGAMTHDHDLSSRLRCLY